MKLKKITLGLVLAIALASCGKNKTIDDIKPSEIKTPCEFADESIFYWTEYSVFLDKKLQEVDGKKLSNEEMRKIDAEIVKYQQLADEFTAVATKHGWVPVDYKECEGHKNFIEDLAEQIERARRREEKVFEKISTPERVVMQYITGLKNQDIEKVVSVCTKDWGELIVLLNKVGMLPTPVNAKDVKCELQDEKHATCTYCCMSEDKIDTAYALKYDEKWLVGIKGEDTYNDSLKKANATK